MAYPPPVSGYISPYEEGMMAEQELPQSDTTISICTMATPHTKASPHPALGVQTSSGVVDSANILRTVIMDALNIRSANASSFSHKNNHTSDQAVATSHDPSTDASILSLITHARER